MVTLTPAQYALVPTAGESADAHASTVAISGDGRYVTYVSAATNLAPGHAIGADVFVRDRVAGVTQLISRTSGGATANDASGSSVAINGDGRYVAFTSLASNLAPGDSNGFTDVFVRDRTG